MERDCFKTLSERCLQEKDLLKQQLDAYILWYNASISGIEPTQEDLSKKSAEINKMYMKLNETCQIFRNEQRK